MNSCQFKWSFLSLSHISRFMIYVSRLYVPSFYPGEFRLMPWHRFQTLLLLFSHFVMSTLCDLVECSTPGFPVHHYPPEFAQTHVLWVDDAIRSSHPLSSPSPPAFNLSQHQSLFQGVSSLHHVAKVLEFQLQHQSFQWIFSVRIDQFDVLAVQGTLKSLL